jgi:hypothetical protein
MRFAILAAFPSNAGTTTYYVELNIISCRNEVLSGRREPRGMLANAHR